VEVLVRFRAAGLNGADMHQLRGGYPAPHGSPQDIPGLELAGEVAARGRHAERFGDGERVMAIVGGGGQAELAVVHERALMPVPDALDWPRRAASGGIHHRPRRALHAGGLRPGERLLVHGARGRRRHRGGAARRDAGARVVATVAQPSTREPGAALGARVVAPDAFADEGPFDVVLELVGAPNFVDNLIALATDGRICIIGVGAGAKAELNLLALMGKRARIHGSTLRPRPLEEKAATARRVERHVLPLVERGEIEVPIAQTFALAEAAQAYERFAAGGKVGKIVLTVD
jgi:NADPH:quinone reductase-like Zn-dependent oxidoreductase